MSSKVSATASIVAYHRAKTDIPYAREIARRAHVGEACRNIAASRAMWATLTPFFELRFKALMGVLQRLHPSCVFELAAGLSPRGLIMSRDPDVEYVEADLPEMIASKGRVVGRILQGEGRRNLHFRAADVRSCRDIFRAAGAMEDITVLHEGLLRYLSHLDKSLMAEAIWCLLRERGGVWVTPDIPILAELEMQAEYEAGRRDHEAVTLLLGEDIKGNHFSDHNEALAFYADNGFRVTRYRQLEIAEGFSMPSNAAVRRFIEHREVWVLRAVD